MHGKYGHLVWAIGCALALALWLALGTFSTPASQAQTPVGTAFAYQGQLRNAAGPINGTCDLRFRLYDSQSGGSQVGSDLFRMATPVANGLFATELDFGAVFTGAARWLEVGVRCPAGGGNYAVLTPRARVAPVPYAMLADRVANLDSTPGDLVVNGAIKSTRSTPDAVNGAGALDLENPTSGNRWHIATTFGDDALVMGLLDAQDNWREGAAISSSSNGGHLTTGVLRGARAATAEDERGGILQLLNTASNNMWEVFSRFGTDNLEIWFGDNSSTWTKALTVERDGDLVVEGELFVAGDSLRLSVDRSTALTWGNGEAAVGYAGGEGHYSVDAQPGDLVIRAANGTRIVLGRGATATNYPAAITVEASGLVSIPNLQTGGVIESKLQTADELASATIDRFAQGDVLCWNAADRHLVQCRAAASLMVVAIANADGKPLIAGVEPVRVCGGVQPGDLLVASDEPGCAVAWSQIDAGAPPPGVVIAKALEGAAQAEALVLALILAR